MPADRKCEKKSIQQNVGFLLQHREHGTSCQRSWNCCDWQTCFVVIWKNFCLTLSTGTRIRIDSVMRPRSSSRGGQIKVTQLQLQLQNVTRQNMTKQTAFQDVQRHTSGVSIPLLQRSSDDQMDYLTKPSPAGFQTSVKMWQSSQVNKSRKIVLLQFMHMIMYNFINYETTCNSQ